MDRYSGFLKIHHLEILFCIHVMKLLFSRAIVILLLLWATVTKAQEVFLSGSRSQALAGLSVSLSDCWSVFGNQAGLAQINQLTIGGTFNNRFWIKELSASSGLCVLPVHSSVFAISVYQFGQTSFRQEKLALAYARSLNPRLNVGFQFNYYRYFLPEENRSMGTPGLELGLQYQLTDQLLLGLHTRNPYQLSLQTLTGEYTYPSRYNLGAFFQLSESFAVATELQKNHLLPLTIKTGLEYDIVNRLFIRTGIAGRPYQLSAGMGFEVNKMKIDLAVAYHQFLGNSPSFSFQYQF